VRLSLIIETTINKSIKSGDIPVGPEVYRQVVDRIKNISATWPREIDNFVLWLVLQYIPDPSGMDYLVTKFGFSDCDAGDEAEKAKAAIENPNIVYYTVTDLMDSKLYYTLGEAPPSEYFRKFATCREFFKDKSKDPKFVRKLNNLTYNGVTDKFGYMGIQDSQLYKDFESWSIKRENSQVDLGGIPDEETGGATRQKCTDGEPILNAGDGFVWFMLGDTATQDSVSLGHCGNASREGMGDKMYSLRKNDIPHVTMSVSNDGTVRDLVGVGDKKPHDKYYKYIVPILINHNYVRKIVDAEAAETRFVISDIPDTYRRRLLSSRPDIAKKSDKKQDRELDDYKHEQRLLDQEAGLVPDWDEDEDENDWMDA
jgi:hypothetical protein